MADPKIPHQEPTAVDDVRRVREQIARQHDGDLRAHMEETNRIFEQLRAKLKLKVVPPRPTDSRISGT
ncbi:MAG TPA: hypothetical protein VN541_01225 [Tepidisphaeraceae bacterium]|nr:hypothetical protein [Tepidisphaeraceae bacterium]